MFIKTIAFRGTEIEVNAEKGTDEFNFVKEALNIPESATESFDPATQTLHFAVEAGTKGFIDEDELEDIEDEDDFEDELEDEDDWAVSRSLFTQGEIKFIEQKEVDTGDQRALLEAKNEYLAIHREYAKELVSKAYNEEISIKDLRAGLNTLSPNI